MSTYFLINTVQVGTTKHMPGETIDDNQVDIVALQNAGGLLWPSSDATVAAAAAKAINAHLVGRNEVELESIMQGAVQLVQQNQAAVDTLPACLVATHAALKAVPAALRPDGTYAIVTSGLDGSPEQWRFSSASVIVDASENIVVSPTVGTGKWLRVDKRVTLWLPFTFATADAAVMFTMPAGARLHPCDSWWEIDADMTGGASSAIGLHASTTGFTTKGDLLGGAAGDVAATLVAASKGMVGTIGAKLATRTLGRLVMVPTETILFDRITSVFAAGSGKARVVCDLLANAGA